MIQRAFCCLLLVLPLGLLAAGDTPPPILPQTAEIPPKKSLQEFLQALREQTGNEVQNVPEEMLACQLGWQKGTFWPLFEQACRSAKVGYTTYGPTKGVALTDRPLKDVLEDGPRTYANIFRLAIKRAVVSRDFESGKTTCRLTIDTAWEPRYEPLYFSLGAAAIAYEAGLAHVGTTEKVPTSAMVSVAGRSAIESEIHFPGPKREFNVHAIAGLQGKLSVVMPEKMLDFHFDLGKPEREATQEGVKVAIVRLVTLQKQWLVDVQIDNPPGGAEFESYQSWLDNNRIFLRQNSAADGERWEPEPNGEQQIGQVTARRAVVRYSFAVTKKRAAQDWTLYYRTPGRIVQMSVPYDFKRIPLP